MPSARMNAYRTITFLGCGKISTAVLKGLLRALTKPVTSSSSSLSTTPSTITNGTDTTIQIEKIIACVRSEESADRLRKIQPPDSTQMTFEIRTDDHQAAIQAADLIILGCKPWQTEALLSQSGMCEAFKGKTLLSIVGGISVAELRNLLLGQQQDKQPDDHQDHQPHHTHNSETEVSIIRIMPSVTAAVGSSVTIMLDDPRHFPPPTETFTSVTELLSLFSQVERVSQSTFNAATTVCSSGPAFAASLIGAYANAAEKQGLDREVALRMAASVFEGTARLMLEEGVAAEEVCRRVATPGGPTAVGLEMLREQGLQEALDGVLEHTVGAMVKHPDE